MVLKCGPSVLSRVSLERIMVSNAAVRTLFDECGEQKRYSPLPTFSSPYAVVTDYFRTSTLAAWLRTMLVLRRRQRRRDSLSTGKVTVVSSHESFIVKVLRNAR